MNIYISYRTLRCPWKTNLKKIWKINFEEKKLFDKRLLFIAYNTHRPPISVHKKFQPNWSCRLAGYTQHIIIIIIINNQPTDKIKRPVG